MNTGTETRAHRAVGLSLLGFMILLAGLFAMWTGSNKPAAQAGSSTYQYSVAQDAKAAVHYIDSDFFNNTPASTNNAYVAALTDSITASFRYDYTASSATNLTSTYDVTAQIRANYAVKGNTEDLSNVWSRDYQLVKPVTTTAETNAVSLARTVTVPYAEYVKTVDSFRTALALPTNSEVVVTFNVRVSGTIDGTAFNDARTSTVSAPLDQQIYIPGIKFDKTDTKQITPQSAADNQNRWAKLELVGGGVTAFAGVALLVYGMRKRIFKSAYQRELDKIYRYHDGIIVRTSRPIDLTDHQVVPMRSFDDMLNLEEELKSPIIADEISSTLTHFIIANNNVTYLYKLGDGNDHTNQIIATRTTSQALTAAQHPKAAREVLAPAAPARNTIAVQHANTGDDWGDIINELDSKPATPSPAVKPPVHPVHAIHKKKIQ